MRITPTSLLALSSIACSLVAYGQASQTSGALKGTIMTKGKRSAPTQRQPTLL